MSLLFSPYELGQMTLKNRIVMPPMCTYSVDNNDGCPTVFHQHHYAARAVGGVGLIIIEATAVEPRGRISNRDLGLWHDDQIDSHRSIVDTCHRFGAKVAVQLAHAGRKSECTDSMPVAPTAIPFSEMMQTPQEMTAAEIEQLPDIFLTAAHRAIAAGYDLVELHSAHGYLLNEFLSPLTNKRQDSFGGTLENRCSLTIKIASELVQKISVPVSVRISAEEWHEGGWELNDSIYLAQQLKKVGVSVVHVSSGGNQEVAPLAPPFVPLYQSDYAKQIRVKADIPTIAVGLITSGVEGEALLLGECCDLVAYGRELLRSPNFPMFAAKQLVMEVDTIPSYRRAFL